MKTVQAIIFREIRTIWMRLLVIFLITDFMLLTDRGTDQLIVPAMLFGLLMGVDFGTRDKTTGFDLTLLTVPVSQRRILLIRFLVRFTLLVILSGALVKTISPYTVYSRSVEFSLFWLFILFFATTVASLCCRKIIISISLGLGLVMGWYLLLIGVASLEWLDSPLLYIAIIPSTLSEFCIAVSVIMFMATLLIVSGGVKHAVQSRALISMRQSVFIWLGGAVFSAICLLLIPEYYAMKPLESATEIMFKSINGPNRLLVETRHDGFPLGTWVVDDHQRQRVSDIRSAYRFVSSIDGEYLLAMCSDIRDLKLEVYAINESDSPGMNQIRQIDANVYVRTVQFDVSPVTHKALLTISGRGEANHLLIADMHNADNDTKWSPPDMDASDRVYGLGWIDDTEFMALLRRQDRIEIWRSNGTEFSRCIWRQPEDLEWANTIWKEPLHIWHDARQSVFMAFTSQQTDHKDEHYYQFIEVDIHGQELLSRPNLYKSVHLNLIDPHCDDSLLIVPGGKTAQLLNLNTAEQQPVMADTHQNLSPDCKYYAYVQHKDGQRILRVCDTATGNCRVETPMARNDQLTWINPQVVAFISPESELGYLNVETGEYTRLFTISPEGAL